MRSLWCTTCHHQNTHSITNAGVTRCYGKTMVKILHIWQNTPLHRLCIWPIQDRKGQRITAFTNKANPTKLISWHKGDAAKYIRMHTKWTHIDLNPLKKNGMHLTYTMDSWKWPRTWSQTTYNAVVPLAQQTRRTASSMEGSIMRWW